MSLVYDKKLIKQCIWFGTDHIVYNYGVDKVIKFSVVEYILHGNTKTIQDYTTAKQYFGDYILTTEFVTSPNKKTPASIQKKIQGRPLEKNDLRDNIISRQYLEIVKAYELLKINNHPYFDLLGNGGILKRTLSNIYIDNDKRLIIIDSSFLEVFKQKNMFLHIFLSIFRPWIIRRQENIIKEFKACILSHDTYTSFY